MLVIGIAIEEAIETVFEDSRARSELFERRLSRVDAFARLHDSLSSPVNCGTLAGFTELETETYRRGGRITYFAERFLLDIFSDTTERTPTFMLPPFRRRDDHVTAVSWAFAKHPSCSTEEAWRRMLRREPRGIYWTTADYRAMGAPPNLQRAAPDLSLEEIHRYAIGNEPDDSRWDTERAVAIHVVVESPDSPSTDQGATPPSVPDAVTRARVSIVSHNESQLPPADNGSEFRLDLHLEDSAIRLFHHLAVKLVFNTVSTASMALLNRIQGNWMIQLDPTNKKLIDRGTRIISHLAGLPYTDACYELHRSMLGRSFESSGGSGGNEFSSPVVASLSCLQER